MTRHTISRFIMSTLAAASLVVGGCHLKEEDEADDFRNAIPRKETVEMQVPASAGQALEVESQTQGLQGQRADFYTLTRLVTVVVNGGAFAVGVLVKLVIAHPPTTLTADSAVWGPWTEALSPNTWKVTVTRVGDHKYQYKFEGKDKNQPDSAYVTILSGTHNASVDDSGRPIEGFGHGEFLLDWDAAQNLPEHDNNVGKASYIYERMSLNDTIKINAQFRQVRDGKTGNLVDSDYAFTRLPGTGGTMDFTHVESGTPTMPGGKWAVRSRWQSDGAGRADVKATGGNIVNATASECWNQSFASSYRRASWAIPQVIYGNEATDCVFTSAEYSGL